MTAFDPNDERITAYILGDDSLSADDHFAVAELLENNPEARRFADELRAAADLAGLELAAESIAELAATANIETAVRNELALTSANGVANPSASAGVMESSDIPAQSLGNATPRKGWMRFAQWSVAAGLVVGMGFYFAPKLQVGPQTLAMRQVDSLSSTSTPMMAKSVSNKASGGFTAGNTDGYGSVVGGIANDGLVDESRKLGSAAKADDLALQGLGEGGGGRGGRASEPAPDKSTADRWLATTAPGQKASKPSAPGDAGVTHLYAIDGEAKESKKTGKPVDDFGDQSGVTAKKELTDLASVVPKSVEALVTKRNPTLAYAEAPSPAAEAKPPASGDGRGRDYYRFGADGKAVDAPSDPVPFLNKPAEVVKLQTELFREEAEGLAKLRDGSEEAARRRMMMNPAMKARYDRGFNTDSYPVLKENEFLTVNAQNALSTFSTDVDTASYSLVRKFLTQNTLPPPGAVRLEEMVNYFRYNYQTPTGDTPFAANLEIAECPWNPQNRLARIALKGKVIADDKRPPSNLVFLVDISGSMDAPNRLPLVRESLKLLVDKLGENDRVAIAVYASSSGLVLDSTNASKKSEIVYAIDNLRPSGSTNGASGIKTAYDAAVKGFIQGGTNRVILCTDGDFNVGITSNDELVNLITEKAKSGVFLSILGYGMGNHKDDRLMQLSNKGNGNYGYIDTIKEAQKLLVEQMSGTLVTIAKDVKIQVEFNPAKVGSYRLLGYEKRMLKAEDFKDDKKDAGEIGAGHTVTALYELTPPGMSTPAGKTDPLVFQKPTEPAKVSPELANAVCIVKLRYKQPEGSTSTEVSFPANDEGKKYTQASEDFRFAAAAASFAMILRDSPYKGNANLAAVLELAQAAKGQDPGGYRAEFIKLIEKAKELKK